MKSITETLNAKIQGEFIYYGVHDILDSDETAELTEKIIKIMKKDVIKVVQSNKLPYPNKYGDFVQVKRVNSVILEKIEREIEQIV